MKIICNINSELCVIAGIITGITDEGKNYTIRVKYDEGDGISKETVETDVIFTDRAAQAGNPDKPKLYAKWAREKNASIGDRIIIFARFPSVSNRHFANGYSCKLNGIISINDENRKNEMNVVSGLVDQVMRNTSRKEPFLAIEVYLGSNPFNGAKRTTIYIFDRYLANRCLRDLIPKRDGTKTYAAFLCGQAFPQYDRSGAVYDAFKGFDFTVMGETGR